MTQTIGPIMLDEKAVAALLSISRTRLKQLIKDHVLPAPRRHLGVERWHREEVERTLARLWGLSNDVGSGENVGVRNKMLEAARAFRPPASR